MNRREIGKEAEEAARAHLKAQGLNIILQNFSCRTGELDIVAFHGRVLVVAEVRMRTQTTFVDAASSVGPRKQRRIIGATKYLLLTHPQLRPYPVRFDVVALDRAVPQDRSRIVWIRDAFQVRA